MDARKLIKNVDLQTGDDVLVIKDGEFSWNKDALQPTLEGINMTVRKGELVGILGRVGSGKVSWGWGLLFSVWLVLTLCFGFWLDELIVCYRW